MSDPVALLTLASCTKFSAQGWTVPVSLAAGRPLDIAHERMRRWLSAQGLDERDVTVDVGSGQSRAERGKPRAMVELLRTAWRSASLPTLLESLPRTATATD